jgi:hypothetical protein
MAETENTSGTYESRDEAFKDAKSTAQYWLNALKLAGDGDEKKWRDSAKKAVEIYEGDKQPAFNILHSNTETLKAAVYNSQPTPDIRPRWNGQDQAARKGGTLIERALVYGMDEYDFDDEMRAVIHELTLAGRGVAWVEYHPLTRTVQIEDANGQPQQVDEVVWQQAKCVRIPYDRYRQGKSDSYGQVPWVARFKGFTRDELKAIPGISPAVVDKVPLDMSTGDIGEEKTEAERSPFKMTGAWEIWDKDTRQVFYVAPSYPDGPLAVVPDPLGLLDFLPCPRPLVAIRRQASTAPVVPYDIYKKQAEELNTVSERILALVGLLKYRGIRAAEVSELDALANADDGEFIPSTGALSVLAQQKSLNDAIWVMPIEKIIVVVRELIVQRNEIKQSIFEITGIADIMRGASSPSETLGAQQLKAQWGSLRVQDLQRDIQRFVRDLFRLKAEIIASKFTEKSLGLLNGGPVEPEVMAILRNDVQRSYSIDVESDSTIRGDLARSQQNMSMFLQGTAQFAQSIGPLISSPANPMGVIPPELALTVYASFARQFKLGKEVEDKMAEFIQKAQQTGVGQETPEQQQKKAEAEQIQKAGLVADVQNKTAAAEKTKLEAEGQQIENMRQAVTPIEQPQPGFVQ